MSGAATAHDQRGNLTTDQVNVKSYTNLLLTSSGGTSISLAYDPMMHTAGRRGCRPITG